MRIEENSSFAIIEIENWEEYLFLCKKLHRWIFRGQSDPRWDLKTSLERILYLRGIDPLRWSVSESFILLDFQKAAHNVLKDTPDKNALTYWLSIIQHYGGPTRFLDFSTSFYIASFFALQHAINDCAIWAFNRAIMMGTIVSTYEELINKFGLKDTGKSSTTDQILKKTMHGEISEQRIITVAPPQESSRQYNQKGISIIPLSLTTGVIDCARQMFNLPDQFPSGQNLQDTSLTTIESRLNQFYLVKIILKSNCHLEGKIDLQRMNLNYFSLFGGIEGLVLHLKDSLNTVEAYEKLNLGD